LGDALQKTLRSRSPTSVAAPGAPASFPTQMNGREDPNRGPRHAEAFNGELERLLSQGWTVADPAALDQLGLRHLLAAT
jgi:hypothetical protein